jgi:hypothetical protein
MSEARLDRTEETQRVEREMSRGDVRELTTAQVVAESIERHQHHLLGRRSFAVGVVSREDVPAPCGVGAIKLLPDQPKRCTVPGLLEQLTLGGGRRRFGAVDVPARDLQEPDLRSRTELAHEDDFSVRRQRDHDGAVRLGLDLVLLEPVRRRE